MEYSLSYWISYKKSENVIRWSDRIKNSKQRSKEIFESTVRKWFEDSARYESERLFDAVGTRCDKATRNQHITANDDQLL